MAGVFISHASADRVLVDPFVDDVIRLGCGVPRAQLFYSSGEDTGVPSGADLNAYVRHQVADASIVVAIISPTFQTRPFCVAELGAAWAKVGNLFPIAVPGMERTDLEGVLVGMIVKHLDEGSALDELHARVGEAVGKSSRADTWGRYREKWLAKVDTYAGRLPAVRIATPDELDRLEAELSAARGALRTSDDERRVLEERVDRLAAAKSAAEVEEILLPDDEVARFEQLRSAAADAVSQLDDIVAEAMWFDLFEDGLPWPESDYPQQRGRVDAAKRDGVLVENSSELLVPDTDVAEVAKAYEAVERLRGALSETSERFDDWFRRKYGMRPDLRKKRIWDALLEL